MLRFLQLSPPHKVTNLQQFFRNRGMVIQNAESVKRNEVCLRFYSLADDTPLCYHTNATTPCNSLCRADRKGDHPLHTVLLASSGERDVIQQLLIVSLLSRRLPQRTRREGCRCILYCISLRSAKTLSSHRLIVRRHGRCCMATTKADFRSMGHSWLKECLWYYRGIDGHVP